MIYIDDLAQYMEGLPSALTHPEDYYVIPVNHPTRGYDRVRFVKRRIPNPNIRANTTFAWVYEGEIADRPYDGR